MLISLFGHILMLVMKILLFADHCDLFNCTWFAKISLMKINIRKSRNNTLAPYVCEIKGYVTAVEHFIVKLTHRLYNSVTARDIAKFSSCIIQWFFTQPLLITTVALKGHHYISFSLHYINFDLCEKNIMWLCIHNYLACIHNYLACIHKYLACIHNYLACIHN